MTDGAGQSEIKFEISVDLRKVLARALGGVRQVFAGPGNIRVRLFEEKVGGEREEPKLDYSNMGDSEGTFAEGLRRVVTTRPKEDGVLCDHPDAEPRPGNEK
ncbi:MAG: hypothetical protein ACJAVK_000670 [Akkermansiaceae bacterium]